MERITEIVVNALRRALAEPGEHRLYKSGKLDGLFPGRGGVNGEAALGAVRDGLFAITGTEKNIPGMPAIRSPASTPNSTSNGWSSTPALIRWGESM